MGTDGESPGFDAWVERVAAGARLTPAGRELVRVLAQNPERASYASTRALAGMARVDVSNVTRLAQALGFAGWTEFRAELRTRYLQTLSLTEIAEQHRDPAGSPASARSIDADRRSLSLLRPETAVIADVVAAIAAARGRVTLGGGTYGAIAQILASHCTVAGYPAAFLPEGAAAANGLVRLEPGDVAIAIGLWRPYQSTVDTLREARSLGIGTVAITDVARSPLTEHADHVILVPSEGAAHFPTLVGVLATVNLLCTELAELDPERTRASLSRHEAMWDELRILYSE